MVLAVLEGGKEEVDEWREKCPLKRAKARLIEDGVEEAQLDELEKNIISKLEEDQKWALEQPFPTLEQATDHVMIPLKSN